LTLGNRNVMAEKDIMFLTPDCSTQENTHNRLTSTGLWTWGQGWRQGCGTGWGAAHGGGPALLCSG
jgi:hypothetical protein